MIVIVLILVGVAVAAFAAVIIGVQITDHRMSLRDPSHAGFADAFARWVLGVYVRQPSERAQCEDRTADCGQGRR
jgi:hypothetical protein